MKDRPLVSVLMPAYNTQGTIGRSIQSLLCQTYQNWECIVVNDGSTDNTKDVVAGFADSRLSLFNFNENKGRGVARQKALSLARGKYVTMLDSDDWIYPEKIESQVDYMEANPICVLHTCGMAIVSEENDLLMVRRPASLGCNFFGSLKPLPVFHAPSMFRRAAAVGLEYDARFQLAQDMDFLRRLLWQKSFYVSGDIFYVYDEIGSVGLKKICRSYLYNARGYTKFLGVAPFQSLRLASFEIAKIGYVALKTLMVGRRRLLLGRSVTPAPEDVQKFMAARRKIFAE